MIIIIFIIYIIIIIINIIFIIIIIIKIWILRHEIFENMAKSFWCWKER